MKTRIASLIIWCLALAAVPDGDPVFWDENYGTGCGGSDGNGSNCPSMASESVF